MTVAYLPPPSESQRVDVSGGSQTSKLGDLRFVSDEWEWQQGLSYSSCSTRIEFLEDRYPVLKPIPVTIDRSDEGVTARFEKANIAISGRDDHDAYQALVHEILDTFDVLRAERPLGPDAKRQLAVLRDFIGET